ncbi:MarR family winged helix-turn-helix transcriptional regulator [Rhodococcoides kyotonense]|uniref:HTH marR-type domain-containing protein n=1 Tax=Rhodococcoides kyotonense TaxID=398843 RepID=A0A177YL54_9NOCA|nr:hypothetical protein A3K89_17265 [Rhodococcus kyotonensis]
MERKSANLVDVAEMRLVTIEDIVTTELESAATLMRVSNILRTRLDEAVTRQRMSWAGYEVLDAICRKGPMSYRSLSSALDRHRTSITSIVTALVSSGYVTRRRGGSRPDEFLVETTDLGVRRHERARVSAVEVSKRMFESGDASAMLHHLRGLDSALRAKPDVRG